MSSKTTQRPAADAWGIDDGYEDAMYIWRTISPATRAAIRASMGSGDEREIPPSDAVLVTKPGRATVLRGPAEVLLEDGTLLHAGNELPPDLPLGYHTLRPLDNGRTTSLIVSPGRCFVDERRPIWGWAAQLYAARSTESWGIGDLADLRRLGRWSAGLGAGILAINPLQAVAPVLTQEPSPYSPSSRRYRNPLYLRIEEVPGAGEAGLELDPLAAAGRALNAHRRIDRDAVFRLKSDALNRLWARFAGDPRFDGYCRDQGESLREFAAFCVLAERFGPDWHSWPAEYRRPELPAVAEMAAEHAGQVRYHQWLQWLLDEQLAEAARAIPLLQDLPVGVDPGGADAWAWQDVLARDVSVGAPPDIYNTQGQNWGLPPFVPHKLRACGYRPFIETIRAMLRHAGGLRIDHVLGLFRLFWIPYGFGAGAGAFVRYPADDLLAIIDLESHRAGAFIAGEDLGTVEEHVEATLREHRILTYRVLWFEKQKPATYPQLALAAVTTHDLPTIAGLWTGQDLKEQTELGLEPNAAAIEKIRVRLKTMIEATDETPPPEVIRRTYELLAEAPSLVVTPSLDDALAVEERPNMPGLNRWPNWCIPLPKPLEAIEQEPLAHAIAQALNARTSTEADA